MHVYEVEVDGRSLGFFEAKSKNEARIAALKNVAVRRVDSSEVIGIMRRGIAIVSAETGYVCNGSAEPAPDEGQQALAMPEPEGEGDSDKEGDRYMAGISDRQLGG